MLLIYPLKLINEYGRTYFWYNYSFHRAIKYRLSWLVIISRWGPYWAGDVPDVINLHPYPRFWFWPMTKRHVCRLMIRPSLTDYCQSREKSIKCNHIILIWYYNSLLFSFWHLKLVILDGVTLNAYQQRGRLFSVHIKIQPESTRF